VAAKYRSQFWKRLEWIFEHRGVKNVTALTLDAGLAKGTVANQLAKADEADREPEFKTPTLAKLAGAARVSQSWLQGLTADPDGPDIPEAPQPDPLDVARRKFGAAAANPGQKDVLDRLARLESQVAVLYAERSKK
jgi:hypothetical protein